MSPDRITPKVVKPWEAGPPGVVRNPDLVKLNVPNHQWQPIKYVSYLWLLVDEDDLRVGIETQAEALRDDKGHALPRVMGTPPTKFLPQQQRYGHPTLANKSLTFKALAGGELLFKPHKGGWIINRNSGRYGVGRRTDKSEGDALMETVRVLFEKQANLKVILSSYTVESESARKARKP